MKRLNKNIIIIIVVLTVSFLIIYSSKNISYTPNEFNNVILIGWDGIERESLYKLLDDGKLPNLKKIINEGKIVDMEVTTGETVTKPGWTEILTGYISATLGILNNKTYKPIPKGYTVFERLKNHFGKDNIVTIFVAGKDYNLGAREPHSICLNCFSRYPDSKERTHYLDEGSLAPVREGAERIFEQKEGEPYYHTQHELDVYEMGLGNASNVGPKALSYIEKYKEKKFFAFFHFEEPDEIGHKFGGGSKEYLDSIATNDYWLGEIVKKLKSLGVYEKTLIYITSDHGFGKDKSTTIYQNKPYVFFSHTKSPYVFLATNDKRIIREGDRKDITPTILDRYGIDIKSISPPLSGSSLIKKESTKITFVVREFLSDAPAIIAHELGYFSQEGLNIKTKIVPQGKDTGPLLIEEKADFVILGDKWSLLAHLNDKGGKSEIIADLGGGGRRWRLMVRNNSGITKLEGLNNKKVGVWQGSYGFARFNAYLRNKNIHIEPITIRGMSSRPVLKMLREGNVDGVLIWEPFPSLIEEEGLGKQLLTLEAIGDEMSVYLHARSDFLKKNPNVVEPLFRALERGIKFIKNNPDEASAILSPKLQVSTSAIKKGLSLSDFSLRFDENEEEQINFIIKLFQEEKLHNLPNYPFMKLNGLYMKQYKRLQTDN